MVQPAEIIRYPKDVSIERSVVAVRAAARLAKAVETALGGADLSLPQYRLLALLSDGSSAATALADRLAVSRPSITALVDGLVERGLVERQADAADRRRVAHALTSLGRATLARGDTAVAERLTWLTSHVDDERAATAMEGLAAWHDTLDAARQHKAETAR
jgi:long-chain acyl-CoA synthetase